MSANKNVWILDDDIHLAEAVKIILEEEGYSVSIFCNSTKLYRKLREEKPDIILVDILLGSENGLEICYQIKNNYKVPVVLVSSNTFSQVTIDNSQADSYIQKPFDISTLVYTVDALT